MSMMNNFHRESTKLLQHLPLPKPSSLIYGNNQPWWCQILDPNGEIVTKWNQIFLVTSLIALFVDPLFFYLPNIRAESCMYTDFALAIIVILVRSIVDLFSALQILMKFRTSYVATSSRVFGKGELVRDPRKIVIRYLKTDFVIDLAAALPLPQVRFLFLVHFLARTEFLCTRLSVQDFCVQKS